MALKPRVVVGGLLSEAWVRATRSYTRSVELYKARVLDGTQPSFPVINVFDAATNNLFIVSMNFVYIVVTAGIFFYMKRRTKGFRLRWLLCTYDALNVVLAAYISIQTLRYKLGHSGLLLCNPISMDGKGGNIARVFVYFYLQKFLEFFDTWFFLLRKSTRQVTFLHLFHHSSITVVVGSILPYDYNGDMYLPIMLNSANHMLVYLHYLLATLGWNSWWAQHITSLQLVQFCIIFGQSLVSYRVGPTCGSPDFAKIMMILYMGSMVALFGNFFLQRYVFRRPYTGLDMCGVIKTPTPLGGLIVSAQHCGIATLNTQGNCIVLLPPEFPDPVWADSSSSSSISVHQGGKRTAESTTGPCPYAPFTVAYHLTPLGCAMPCLHVSTEVTKFKASVWRSLSAEPGQGQGQGQGHGHGQGQGQGTGQGQRQGQSQGKGRGGSGGGGGARKVSIAEQSEQKVSDHSTATATATSTSSGSNIRNGGGNNSSSDSSSSSNSSSSHLINTNSSSSSSGSSSSSSRFNNASNNGDSSGNVHGSPSSGSATRREQPSTPKDLMEQEMAILRSYWAATSAEGTESAHSVGSGGGGKCGPKATKIGRSVSTPNLPGYQSSSLRPANSSDSFLNDRLIDGPLPIPLLDGTLRPQPPAAAICQLDRAEGEAGGVRLPGAERGARGARAVEKNTSLIGGVIPLCFVISGGVPGGRISWIVTTLPRSGAADVSSFAEDDFALGSSSSPSFSNFDVAVGDQNTHGGNEGLCASPHSRVAAGAEGFGGTKDWRAL